MRVNPAVKSNMGNFYVLDDFMLIGFTIHPQFPHLCTFHFFLLPLAQAISDLTRPTSATLLAFISPRKQAYIPHCQSFTAGQAVTPLYFRAQYTDLVIEVSSCSLGPNEV